MFPTDGLRSRSCHTAPAKMVHKITTYKFMSPHLQLLHQHVSVPVAASYNRMLLMFSQSFVASSIFHFCRVLGQRHQCKIHKLIKKVESELAYCWIPWRRGGGEGEDADQLQGVISHPRHETAVWLRSSFSKMDWSRTRLLTLVTCLCKYTSHIRINIQYGNDVQKLKFKLGISLCNRTKSKDI